MSRSIKRNFVWNASYQILLIIAPLVTIPYVSRVLGPIQVGVYSYTYSITYYFVLFATLGMAQYGVRLIAQAGDNRGERSRRFWSAWAAQLCIAVPICLVYAAYAYIAPAGGTPVALIWGFWVLGAALDVSWLFFGVEEFKMPTVRSFITKIAGISIILVFCKSESDLWAYVLGISLAYFANAVLILPFTRRYVDFYKPCWKDVSKHFLPNLRLFAPVVAMSLYMSFDKIILGSISGMEQAGYFEYADKIAKMPLTIVTALCTVTLPHMTAKLAAGEKSEAVGMLGKSIWLVLGAAIGVAFGISAVSPELVPVFLGPGYEACQYVIPVVAAALPFISASNVIGMQYMLPACSDKAYTRSVWIGAVVNVASCLVLLRPLGAVGAGLATTLTEAAVLVFQCWAVRKDLPLGEYALSTSPFLVLGVIMLLLLRLSIGILEPILGLGWILLVVEILLAVLIYGLLVLAYACKCGKIDLVLSLLKRN
ncbi:MAG: hypothetical protein DBY41_03675 [Clostridium sp.]|nr:MAG: hypothetical protein DBY41_03675 [Clostridium sp.]